MPSQAAPRGEPPKPVEGPSKLQRISKTVVSALSLRRQSAVQEDADNSQRDNPAATTPFAPIKEVPDVASPHAVSEGPDTAGHGEGPDARKREGAGASAASAASSAPKEEAAFEKAAGWYFGADEEVKEGSRARDAGGDPAAGSAPGAAGGLEHLEVVGRDDRERTLPRTQGLPEYDTARSGWATAKLLSASSRSLSSSSRTSPVHEEGSEAGAQRATTPPILSPFGDSQGVSPFAAATEGELEEFEAALQPGAQLSPLLEVSSGVEGEALQKVQTAVSAIEKRGQESAPRARE